MLVALGTLFVASEARAITVAPMCDQVGASVAAPIPALPNATGELRAFNSCDHDVDTLQPTAPTKQRAALESAFDPDQRVFSSCFTLAPPPSRTVPVAQPDRVPVFAEHRESVYRPPRS